MRKMFFKYWNDEIKKFDDAMFFYKPDKNGKCEGIFVLHVDDFHYGGSSIFEKIINVSSQAIWGT